jgi:hypothetical protein
MKTIAGGYYPRRLLHKQVFNRPAIQGMSFPFKATCLIVPRTSSQGLRISRSDSFDL